MFIIPMFVISTFWNHMELKPRSTIKNLKCFVEEMRKKHAVLKGMRMKPYSTGIKKSETIYMDTLKETFTYSKP